VTVERSYHLYCEQYRRHLDELSSFMSGLSWDMDRLTIIVKGDLVTLTRTDSGKRTRLHFKQLAGVLRYVAEGSRANGDG